MIEIYRKAGGVIHSDYINSACFGTFSWINWLVYNIERACAEGQSDYKALSIEQVNQTLGTILQLTVVIPDIIKTLASI